MGLSIVILAAGQGTRMRSELPKVLHPVGGTSLLGHVLNCAEALEPERIVVVHGHKAGQVRAAFAGLALTWVEQEPQLGTGHAVQQAVPEIPDGDEVLILYGDVPLIRAATLQRLHECLSEHSLAVLTVMQNDPSGYGRILRDDSGAIVRIVEEKDASPIERKIREVNTGIMAARGKALKAWLSRIGNENAQQEYYLTDCIALAAGDGEFVAGVVCHDPMEVAGVNDKRQLAQMERAYQRIQADALMQHGATLIDPERIDIRGRVNIGRDVTLDINVVFEGEVSLGHGVTIGPNCYLRDCRIENGSEILANCVIEEAEVGPDCRIGPFARLRPGTRLNGANHVGNFVEIKKSEIRTGSKVNHLSYIGDSQIGERVNVGAGTITCNYDGANKHRTVIGDDAFIGSNTALVAPVEVGAGATIGAGSVITRDAVAGELTVARGRQTTIKGWTRPTKAPKS